jgi:hypothetical protein
MKAIQKQIEKEIVTKKKKPNLKKKALKKINQCIQAI